MGLFDFGNKKEAPILNDEDKKELREIQRKSYMEEARIIMEQRGKEKAQNELISKPKKSAWDMN